MSKKTTAKKKKRKVGKRVLMGIAEQKAGAATARKAARRPPKKTRMIAGQKAAPEVSSEAVAKATGRTWEEWVAVLDKAGARRLEHKQIADLVATRFDIGPWWCQTVTVGYERVTGKREKHQTPKGYSISASRTMGASAAAVFAAWRAPAMRRVWLGEPLEVRTATPNRTLRITWGDGTSVDVALWRKERNRTQVAVQHSRLLDAEAASKMKSFWFERLVELERVLCGEGRVPLRDPSQQAEHRPRRR